MKKLAIAVLLVAAGCRRTAEVSSSTPSGPNEAGGSTPREAVQRFLAAASAQDLQALALVWGTSAGPAQKTMDKDERDKREIVMLCFLKHDSARIIGEAPATNSERVLAVEMMFKDLTRSTSFYATRASSRRWFVRHVDLDPLRDICAKK